MNSILLTWSLPIVLALIMGLVSDRTNLCSVCAVREVFMHKQATVFFSFVKIVLWVLGVSIALEYLFATPTTETNSFVISTQSLAGGLLFGVGAVINDGCSLHTLVRLGRGNFGMAISIVGLLMGAIACKTILLMVPGISLASTTPPIALNGELKNILIAALLLWMLIELFRLLRRFSFSQLKSKCLAPTYRLSSGAALLGITNGILFTLVGTWTYSYTLVQSTTNLVFPGSDLYKPIPGLLWLLLFAYLGGIVLSSIYRRRLVLATHPRRQWLSYFSGGILMGVGAALIPGGNDVLLLNAIPGLASHAIPAYLAMLLGIALGLLIQKRFFSASPPLGADM
jgi:uncharacterized membrane protein YedE/YeeE